MYLEITLPKPAVMQIFLHRFCHPEPVEYRISYMWPSRPARKMRPLLVHATQVIVTPSDGIVCSGNGCNVTSANGSEPSAPPEQHTPTKIN